MTGTLIGSGSPQQQTAAPSNTDTRSARTSSTTPGRSTERSDTASRSQSWLRAAVASNARRLQQQQQQEQEEQEQRQPQRGGQERPSSMATSPTAFASASAASASASTVSATTAPSNDFTVGMKVSVVLGQKKVTDGVVIHRNRAGSTYYVKCDNSGKQLGPFYPAALRRFAEHKSENDATAASQCHQSSNGSTRAEHYGASSSASSSKNGPLRRDPERKPIALLSLDELRNELKDLQRSTTANSAKEMRREIRRAYALDARVQIRTRRHEHHGRSRVAASSKNRHQRTGPKRAQYFPTPRAANFVNKRAPKTTPAALAKERQAFAAAVKAAPKQSVLLEFDFSKGAKKFKVKQKVKNISSTTSGYKLEKGPPQRRIAGAEAIRNEFAHARHGAGTLSHLCVCSSPYAMIFFSAQQGEGEHPITML